MTVPERVEAAAESEEAEDEGELKTERAWSIVDIEAVSAAEESEGDDSDETEETGDGPDDEE